MTPVSCIGITNCDGVLVEIIAASAPHGEACSCNDDRIIVACARLDIANPESAQHSGNVGAWRRLDDLAR